MPHQAERDAPQKVSLSFKPRNKTDRGKILGSAPAKSNGSSFGIDENEGVVSKEQQQHISTFDSSVASEQKPQRVIEALPNRDWKDRRRARNGTSSRSTPTVVSNDGQGERLNGSSLSYGLSVPNHTPHEDSENPDSESDLPPPPAPVVTQQTLDQQAYDALTGDGPMIQSVIRPDDDAAFRDDFAEAPPQATLDEYEATPVEGFGAAILRGYLKAGETLETRIEKFNAAKSRSQGTKVPKTSKNERRPALLGIGAKAVEGAEMAEIGAWGKAGFKKGNKGGSAMEYNPLARKDKRTGEIISEEEFQRRSTVATSSLQAPHTERPAVHGYDKQLDIRAGGDNSDSEQSRKRHRDRSSHDRNAGSKEIAVYGHKRRRRYDEEAEETDSRRRHVQYDARARDEARRPKLESGSRRSDETTRSSKHDSHRHKYRSHEKRKHHSSRESGS